MASLPPPRLAQAAIHVRDISRAKSFYGAGLGLSHLFDAPPALAFFQCGDTRLMLSESATGGNGAILYYGVVDVAETARRLEAGGATTIEPAHVIAELEGKPIHLAILDDGEGNSFGLISG